MGFENLHISLIENRKTGDRELNINTSILAGRRYDSAYYAVKEVWSIPVSKEMSEFISRLLGNHGPDRSSFVIKETGHYSAI